MTELILTTACISINKIPIDATVKTLVCLYDLLYPTLQMLHAEAFSDFSTTSLKHVFDNCKETIQFIKNIYNTVLLANYQKYNLRKDSKNSPKAQKNNIVMFSKEGSLFYGIICDIEMIKLKQFHKGSPILDHSLKFTT